MTPPKFHDDTRCDYCYDGGPAWRYPCSDYEMGDGIVVESISDWLACDQCADLIERGGLAARSDLIDRALNSHAHRNGIDANAPVMTVLAAFLVDYYQAFDTHRIGERTPT